MVDVTLRPVGLFLLTDDIRNGQHLIFRYPAKPKKVEAPATPSAAVMGQYISSDTFAKLFRPRSILCGQPLEVVIDSVRHICHPTEVKLDDLEHEVGLPPRTLIFFNVVFELAPIMAGVTASRRGGGGGSAEGNAEGVSIELVKRVAANLAAALLHEEHRCRYVSNETKKMVSVRDRYKLDRDGGGRRDKRLTSDDESGTISSSSGGGGGGSTGQPPTHTRRSSYDSAIFSKQAQQMPERGVTVTGGLMVNGTAVGSLMTSPGSTGKSVNSSSSSSSSSSTSNSGSSSISTNSASNPLMANGPAYGGTAGNSGIVGGGGGADVIPASSIPTSGGMSTGGATTGTPPRATQKRLLQQPPQPKQPLKQQQSRDRGEDDGDDGDDDPRLVDALLQASQLAQNLRDVFYGLKSGLGQGIMLNRWVNVSFRVNEFKELGAKNIKPYHTLLLVEDEAKVLASLPIDASPQLRQLVMAANPMKSLQEIALEMELSLQQVFRLAAHMAYWGHGRVTDTIASSNVYCICPGCDFSLSNPLCAEFSRKFPRRGYSLQQILASFGSGQSLKDLMGGMSKSHHLTLIHMLVWLLQHRFLNVMHQYVYLVLPSNAQRPAVPLSSTDSFSSLLNDSARPVSPSSPSSLANNANSPSLNDPINLIRASMTTDNNDSDGNSDTRNRDSDSLIVEGGSVMTASRPEDEDEVELENRRVNAFLDSLNDGSPAYTLFRRLSPYFREGKMHLREIIWREQLDAGQVVEVLQLYSDVLVVSLRDED